MRALALVLALVAGCAKSDLSDAALVTSLRLLGVQAEPPEARPGDTVKLTAWLANPKGGAVDVTWSACLLPSNGLANVGCTDGSGNGLVALGGGQTLSIVVPAVDAATLGPPDATDGLFLPIVAHVHGSDDTFDAVYRLRLHIVAAPHCTLDPPYDPGCGLNQNPAFDTIDPLGPETVPLATHAGQTWGLYARYSAGSDEAYTPSVPATDGVQPRERLVTQWFATAGTFPDVPVGGDAVQKFTIDRALPPTGGIIDLWIVGHDDRGGTTMAHRSFQLQ